YPWFFQLIQFVLLVFICVAFFTIVTVFLVPVITGVGADSMLTLTTDSPPAIRIGVFIANTVGHLGIFLIPPALFAYAAHPHPLQYLGIRKPGRNIHWLIVFLLALGSLPVTGGIAGLFDQLPLSPALEASKAKFAEQQKALLNLTTPGEFISAIVMVAIVAPIGEELLFRSVMMRFAAKKMVGSIFWPIMLTAVLFASMHFNVVGFISLIIAGMALGYIYYLTGSLMMSIFAHAVINGTQAVLIYFGRNNKELMEMMESNETPWGLFIGGIILFLGAFYWLWKERTPLPKTWTNDFSAEELQQREQEKNNLL
ncbi:MAG TPA: type II CAAX endopeptidase family protein, partial [Chitinophagaceae bacterium]|nr:type II CAAX endopeptidase family protein [Chitinophagaceae bacterium]